MYRPFEVLDPLKLVLQLFVSHHVGTKNSGRWNEQPVLLITKPFLRSRLTVYHNDWAEATSKT